MIDSQPVGDPDRFGWDSLEDLEVKELEVEEDPEQTGTLDE